MATMVRPSLLLLAEQRHAVAFARSAAVVSRLTRETVNESGLTTLMVTHSMTQAVQFGDRVLVMHRGRVAYDLTDVGRRLAEGDLLRLFDQLRWDDRLDEATAAMLGRAYV
jgi:putative ABC transport system ATP-binding protein